MPCTPNMAGCKASCAHRAFVQGYRDERYRQELDLVERSMGYDTEIADNKRVMAEQGRPLINFRDYLKHSRRTEAMPETETLSVDYGNQMAEESLLSIAMAHPNAVQALRDLGPEEFHTPLANEVYKAIISLEDSGIRADAIAVEGYLREAKIGRSPSWDSSLALGEATPEHLRGLQKWQYTAAFPLLAPVFKDEIRTNHQAYQLERIYSWAAETMRTVIDKGATPGNIQWVHNQVANRMNTVKPLFSPPSESLTPARSQHSQRAATKLSRARV